MRTKITIIGIVASVGYFIFHWAKWLADFFAITHLPHDIGELLAAMSDTPALLSWGMFAIGAICVAFLVYDFFWRIPPSAVANTPADKQRKCELISEARKFVVRATAKDGIGTDFKRKLEGYTPFFELRPHLSDLYLRRLNAQRTLYAPGEGTRLPALASWFLDELDRLEKEWGCR